MSGAVSHELIARRAASSPDAVALVEGSREVTYRELDLLANRLAHLLRAKGVRTGDRAAVRLPRGVDLVVALLAVWKAGAAYVPLDPAHPEQRQATMLTDAAPRLVIGDDVVREALRGQDFTAPDVPVSGDHPAYVLHTSGSTGTPKGVVISHAGIGNQLRWLTSTHGLGAGDRVLQKTALTFDAAGWEIWAPLVSGATVVLAPPGAERDASAIVRAVVDYGITVLQVVPSVLRALVEEPGWADCTTLRVLSSGGEQLYADLVQRFLRVAGNCDVEVWNTYGPTECSIDVTAHRFDSLQRSGPVPIGAPIDGMRVVLAPDGELLIGGPGVAHGYLGSPALTAARFVPDPDGPPGERLYRSGDLARFRADGSCEFLGRIDHQVKVNGVRIEPGEIEAVLAAHPDVLQAVVAPFTAANGATRLAAYVRTQNDPDLAGFLAARLPETHVPAAFVELDEFPRTSSGKVDRLALPVPGDRPEVAPSTEAEELVAGVWRELLNVERVGAQDDFFRLGGSSLQLTRLGNRLRAAANVDIPLAALLTATTVAAQARLIDPRPASSVPVRRVPRTGPLPLSFGQQRLWLLDRIHPAAREWVSGLFLRVDASPAAVRKALDTLVARHESLRTRFVVENGEPAQVIDPPRPMELRVVETTPDKIAATLDEDARRGFDLATGPVVRALLFPSSRRLVVLMHHIVCDGWSSAVLEREFHEILADRELSAVDFQYADFAVWQRERLTEDVLDGELTHWRQVLDGSVPLALRTDRPRPASRDARGAVVSFTIPAGTTESLAELGRRSDATPFMTMLTAYATVLARYTAQWDVVIGTPVAGRDRPEIEDVVGFFLNSLVLRCQLAGEMTFEQALETVRNTCKEAFAHQELPFERLVAELAPERDLSRTPLYQVAFDFHGDELTGAPEDDAELSTLVEASQVAKTDLTLYLRKQPDGSMTGMLEYATALFDRTTIERMAGHFERLLRSLAESPRARLDTVDLLPPDELRAARAWNNNPVEAVTASVLDEFERQVAKTPDATALVTDRTVTFAELDAHANRLAHQLRDAGVGPESVVGVLLDRGTDLLAAFLAAWKAGGAYVPLDPDFPADRVGYVLADAQAKVLVTSEHYRDRFDGPVVLADTCEGDASPLPRRTDLDALAYVIYTSGSTGRPKGVQVPHRGLANHVRWAVAELAETGGAPVFSSVAFDLVVPNVWAPLLAGHPTHLLPQDLDLTELGARLRAAAPFGFIKLTPGHLDVLSHQLTPEERAGLADVIVVAGEALPPRLAEQWAHCNLINEYGPTEASVGTCVHPVSLPIGDSVPIGKPLPGMTMHVLDDLLRPVPVGVVGEVFVGGAGVARGYANRPSLTAERFLPDPYGPPGARLYRTGDLARLLPSGDVDFLGRRDHQVKIRGYRVELGEITAVITEHPGVRDAVVVARDGALAAYYVPVAGDVPLTDWCAEKLPAYMVPAAFTALEAFPLNANGKLDHAALPAVEAGEEGLVAPRGVVEERVAEIFTELLGVPVGAHSHFFSSGGNSILAIRLIATIQSEFEVTVPMRAVFEGGTVADLAAVVEEQVRAELDQMTDEQLAAESLLLDESGNR